MLANAAGARGVRGQRAGLFDRPQIGGIEAGNRRVSVDLRLMKRASTVMTGLQWLTVRRPDRCFEGLMNACTNHSFSLSGRAKQAVHSLQYLPL